MGVGRVADKEGVKFFGGNQHVARRCGNGRSRLTEKTETPAGGPGPGRRSDAGPCPERRCVLRQGPASARRVPRCERGARRRRKAGKGEDDLRRPAGYSATTTLLPMMLRMPSTTSTTTTTPMAMPTPLLPLGVMAPSSLPARSLISCSERLARRASISALS